MITLLSLFTVAVLVGAAILVKLFKSAPVGYQDGNGFHFESQSRITAAPNLGARRKTQMAAGGNARSPQSELDPLQAQ